MYRKIRNAVSLLSLILFPLTFYYFSPVLPMQGASEGLIAGSLILFLFLFLSSLVTGRLFCSWICPAGVIQDIAGQSRTKAVKVRSISWIKYLVWIPWLLLVLFLFRRAGGIQGADFFYQTEYGVSLTRFADAVIYGIVILVFYLMSMIFGRRAACHTICWMAPFMVLGKKTGEIFRIPSLKIKTDPEKCVSCGRCSSVCPMSLPVESYGKKGKLNDANCILCGRCIEVCKRNVFTFQIMK
ncbi:4Fe-4S binding protein [Spirochaeta isovalerica]|uniref:Polyferredoxin n=1 Tax=Spirochaeta isovalerica TaxID=150 RepID=A0A841RH81_9SPIO|nr:4Fe-4S binding protein [Spirochaeta isovalerica]MBB6481878.1 polyferredoxin [Spirochaeta isovalerica]